MTVQEMSQEFDILWDNIMSGIAPGLNEYEKSVFLTQAQEEIVKNYFNPKGNKYGEGSEDSKKRIIDFSTLITTTSVTGTIAFPVTTIVSTANPFIIQRDIFTQGGKQYQVVPVNSDEYIRLKSRPFGFPLKRQVWRLPTEDGNLLKFVPNQDMTATSFSYQMTLVQRPKPIILTDLIVFSASMGVSPGVTIGGTTVPAPCVLDPVIHREILGRAVEIAKTIYTDNPSAIGQINTRNE